MKRKHFVSVDELADNASLVGYGIIISLLIPAISYFAASLVIEILRIKSPAIRSIAVLSALFLAISALLYLCRCRIFSFRRLLAAATTSGIIYAVLMILLLFVLPLEPDREFAIATVVYSLFPGVMTSICWFAIRLLFGEMVLVSGDHCCECGYLLVGCVSGRCPECGTLFEPNNLSNDADLEVLIADIGDKK